MVGRNVYGLLVRLVVSRIVSRVVSRRLVEEGRRLLGGRFRRTGPAVRAVIAELLDQPGGRRRKAEISGRVPRGPGVEAVVFMAARRQHGLGAFCLEAQLRLVALLERRGPQRRGA